MMTHFRPPHSGAIVEWVKSGSVRATALLPSGEVARVWDYDAAAVAVDASDARRIRGGVGYGASWVPNESLARLARANVDAIDAATARAEADADAVIAFAATYLSSGEHPEEERKIGRIYHADPAYVALRVAEDRAHNLRSRADGWVRFSNSSCFPVIGLRDYGDAALAAALLRRGKVVVWLHETVGGWPTGWRLCDPETATMAVLCETLVLMIWSCGPASRRYCGSCVSDGQLAWRRAMRARPFERAVDSVTRERSLWVSALGGGT